MKASEAGRRGSAPSIWLLLAVVALGYYGLARLGLLFSLSASLASPVWPPAGFAIAAVALWPRRAPYAILVGAFAAELTATGRLDTALFMGLGNTLEALIGGLLLAHLGGARVFRTLGGVGRLVLVAIMAPIASAAFGVGSLLAAHFITLAAAPNVAWTWYLGDVSGILVVSPLMLMAAEGWGSFGKSRTWGGTNRLETLAAPFLLLVLAAAVFGFLPGRWPPLVILLMPPLAWIAYRMGPLLAAGCVAALDALAIAGTRAGNGPFQTDTANDAFLHLQALVLSVAAMALALGAMRAERWQAEQNLETLVAYRTGLLRREVEERGHAEGEAKTALVKLAASREQAAFKTEFLRTAAHELGNPLTPIKIQVRMLRDFVNLEAHAKGRHSVEILERNVERLHLLVRDMLESARLQAGRLKLGPRPMDLSHVAHEVVETFQEPAIQNGVVLDLETPMAMQMVADPDRLTQVLYNLLSNAMKFTPMGGRIHVQVDRVRNQAIIGVVDTGAGFTPDQEAGLFQPFGQVHDAVPGNGGTGLGLYISKGIVEQHGGRLLAHSDGPGKGATFTVQLPIVAVLHADAAPELAARPT